MFGIKKNIPEVEAVSPIIGEGMRITSSHIHWSAVCAG